MDSQKREYLERVRELVSQVVPDEVDNVPAMMEQFAGREEELINTLQTMYDRSTTTRARKAVHRSKGIPDESGRFQAGAADGTAAVAAASTIGQGFDSFQQSHHSQGQDQESYGSRSYDSRSYASGSYRDGDDNYDGGGYDDDYVEGGYDDDYGDDRSGSYQSGSYQSGSYRSGSYRSGSYSGHHSYGDDYEGGGYDDGDYHDDYDDRDRSHSRSDYFNDDGGDFDNSFGGHDDYDDGSFADEYG